MKPHRFSIYFYNVITYVGVALAFFIFCIETLLYLADLFVSHKTLYLGLLTYLVLPPFLFLGLILIPMGALWKRRRILRGKDSREPHPFHLDFSRKTHRNAVLVFIICTSIFVIASMIGVYKSYHYTDSVEFCGKLCHSVMNPEYTTYQRSPHARVKCVECHIGSGAEWYVKSKFTGGYQVYSLFTEKYPKPIPTPVKNLRPARETCEQCHWPQHFFSPKEKVFHHFLGDESNTYWPIKMLMKVDSGPGAPGDIDQTGVHWHTNTDNDIEYIARDEKRQEIAWLKLTHQSTGEVKEYRSESNPLIFEKMKDVEIRKFDCIDCHNRPSHRFSTPVSAVNEALVTSRLHKEMPYIKREAVKVLSEDYESTDAALTSIHDKISNFYQTEYPDIWNKENDRVEASISEIQNIFRNTQFPEMKVRWDSHPDNIGHMEHQSCFRCHGNEDLKTKEGKTIDKNCSSCHQILSQGPGSENKPMGKAKKFKHPVDLGIEPEEMDCVTCHSDLGSLYEG
ncbi:MAG: NapC/NirT family cytochrome c [Chlamydiae bacterium]|nr:NapC/NirT family cytochrome c [Chlamydiota bacterium]MBI3276983.1 NapC/NirT family cytochrome c [Chlamydiota bacterium]